MAVEELATGRIAKARLPCRRRTYRVLIADLGASAVVRLTKGTNIGKIRQSATGESRLRYTATSQGTLYLEIVVNTAGSAATNLISIR